MDQFTQIIAGSEKAPLFFVEKLVKDITSLCFTQKLKTNETLQQRQSTIRQVWKACEKSNNEFLIDLVAKKALTCKKTGNKNAFRILKFMAKNYKETYAIYTNIGVGLNLYAEAHLRSLITYFRQGIDGIRRERAVDDKDPDNATPLGDCIYEIFQDLGKLSNSITLDMDVEINMENSVSNIDTGA